MKRFFIVIGILFGLLLIPMILWFLEDRAELNVVIIDKTVPNETFREHLGITWLINHFRSTANSLNLKEDYFGFVPNEKEQTYEIRQLPQSYDDADIIYLTDSYGVYEEDLPWMELEKERVGSRTPLIYGGMKMDEWQAIYNRLMSEKKSTFILEFNSFASPTEKAVRDSMTSFLNIKWSGWIGRYFDELNPDLNPEIPQWMLDDYLDGHWPYEGPGFVLVNEENEELVVLLQNEHVDELGIRLRFTDKGTETFALKESPRYHYWFDIVEPLNEEGVLAYYDWDLTEEGKKLLQSHSIPTQFAGVIEQENGKSRSYYFAGDFTDVANVPSIYQYKGLTKIMSSIYKSDDKESSFFWNAYVPMMETILLQSSKEPSSLVDGNESRRSVTYEGNIAYHSRVHNKKYEVLIDGKWQQLDIKGVNIGMGKPGVFPGEAAIREAEYYRWFEAIGEMGANSIRVYTLHPPDFYQALKKYNEKSEQPLYLFHGVWIEEESLEATLDAFSEGHTNDFQAEMKRIVDVIHGNAVVEPNLGHAHGLYSADISEYVIGWILGIEWYPLMVKGTNDKYPNLGEYQGKFVETKQAAPFEYWLAEQMDEIISYEIENYEWMRPISFTNWVTTDLLTHPAEPSEEEDLVSVDPNVIYLKEEMLAVNQFASYHVYPYYPDFLNYEESYIHFVDHRGEKNNYAAYLKELHEAHQMPVLIAEFGVPGSRGLTHENPFGWNQGFLSEDEQGKIIVRLYEDIMHEGMLGGLVFTWQDEWFKRTWNTMDYDNPNRRPFWSNAQTNEQHFGLLSFDRLKIRLDGDKSDWENIEPLYMGNDDLRALYVDHDERYLYVRLDMKHANSMFKNGYPLLLFDTIQNQGNETIESVEDVQFEMGIDFLLYIKGKEDAKLLVDSFYDFFSMQYVHQFKMLNKGEPLPTNNSGVFKPIYLTLNQELLIPSQNRTIPFSYYETGKLKHGNGNPDSENYDSLADFHIHEKDGMIEIRIPWLLLNVKDPSTREVMGNIFGDDPYGSEFIEGIQIAALYVGDDKVIDSLPKRQGNQIMKDLIKMYRWETWEQPQYEERLKRSYYLVKEAFTAK